VDLAPVLLVGFMWLVVNALRKAGGTPPGGKRPSQRPPGSSLPGSRPDGTTRSLPSTGGDATQREGLRLEALLRDLGRTLDQASGPIGRAPDRRLPPAEEVEEVASREVPTEVRSLEAAPARAERAVVDQDEEAELVAARRIEAAEANSAPRTGTAHRTFDARIRQEPADKTATRAYTVRQLRDAVVWREILGPPVSLRGEEGRGEEGRGEEER
jgi:hypothetical protein